MNVLLVGNGGREHALAWKIAQSSLLDTLFVTPGNPGTARHGKNTLLDLKDHEAVAKFLLDNQIRIVVVGPEMILADGLHDRIAADPRLRDHVTVIGPKKKAARLESSKNFAKDFMFKHNIPTAAHRSFGKDQLGEAIAHLDEIEAPYVIKADGLAAGKGVVITKSKKEASEALQDMLASGRFGKAGERVVIEQFIAGIELSVFLITDGTSFKMLPSAKDYKRIGNDDTGANTGGMGAVSPAPFADRAFMQKVNDRVVVPTIRGMQEDGIEYQGFLFIGLMNKNNEPYVIEYNVRLGDPETQVIMPRLRSDLLDLFEGIATGTLSEGHVDVDDRTAVGVVLASDGYPDKYKTGFPITGIEEVQNAYVFHAGTALQNDHLVTDGGRVLSATAFGKDIEHAISNAYKSIAPIQFKGKYHRTDIGLDLVRKPQKA